MAKKYMLFTTPVCPACPPVKALLKDLEAKGMVKGELITVADDASYEKAERYHITKAPTVVFFDEQNNELGRANSTSEVKSIVFDY